MPSESREIISAALRSGATGGSATGLGVEYQTLYAVHVALELISRLLRANPIQRPQLIIEPRLIEAKSLTRWDLLVEPDRLATEAKARPTKNDLTEFLQRALAAASKSPDWRFELVYGEASIGFLAAIKKLLRLAAGCGGDESRLRTLCDFETDDDLVEVLSLLGDRALNVATRLRLKPFPEHAIDDAIRFQLRYLVPTNQARHLSDALFSLFVRGMKDRKVFFIRAVIQELTANGIEFANPGQVIPEQIDATLHRIIYNLQRCTTGLPIEVLAAIGDEGASGLAAKLQQSMAVVKEDGLWRNNPLPSRIDHPNASAILEQALRAVLEYIRQNKQNGLGQGQIENALAVLRECARVNPMAATIAFEPLDKLLKRRGRKAEILEIAEITVNCARGVPRTKLIAKSEAKALVCGHCWVYQRIGQLELANVYGEQSLSLGKEIEWPRNTAFCLKCLGRLNRVRAEYAINARARQRFLNQSGAFLEQAIEAFTNCEDYGADDPEVGDCQSLLGRTHLLAGRPTVAASCAAKARQLITDLTSKDFMDLLILEGEIAARCIDYPAAERRFSEALELLDPSDYEKSEIAARAFLARGVSRWEWKKGAAKSRGDIETALRIWRQSDEHFYAGVASWTLIELFDEIPRRAQLRLKEEIPSVRVEFVRLRKAASKKGASATLAQRAELNDSAWSELVRQARNNVAVRDAHW